MEIEALVKALRQLKVPTGSLVCLGCGYEHNCGVHGCAILKDAADALEWQFKSVEIVELAGGDVQPVAGRKNRY